MEATSRGDLARSLDDGRRKRTPQIQNLITLLKQWILG